MFHNLLQKAGKQVGIDLEYIAGNGVWVFGSYVAGAAVGLISVLVLANVVSPEVFGEYQFYLAILPFVMLFTLPGINTIVVREVAQNKKIDITKVIFQQSVYGSVASVLLFGISFWFYINGTFEQSIGFIVLAVFTPFIFSSENAVSYLRGKKDFKRVALHEFILKVSTTGAVILVAFLLPDPVLFLLVFLLAKFINRLVLVFVVERKADREVLDVVETKPLIAEAQKLSVMGTLLTLSYSVDRLIVWLLLGSVGLASYSVALAFPQQITAVIALIIHSILVPKLATRDLADHQYRKAFLKKVSIFGLVYMGLSVLYVLFAFFFFDVLFSQYHDMLWNSVYALLTLGLPLVTSIFWLLFLVAKEHTILWKAAILQWVGLAVLFVLLRPENLFEIMTIFIVRELFTIGFLVVALVFNKKVTSSTTDQSIFD